MLCDMVVLASRRYLLEVATSDIESKTAEEEPGLQTQMLHQYLEPVKVRITTEFGGALAQGHDCRSFVIQVRVWRCESTRSCYVNVIILAMRHE